MTFSYLPNITVRKYFRYVSVAFIATCFAFATACSSKKDQKPLAFVSTEAGIGSEAGEMFGIAEREGVICVSDGDKGEIKMVRDGMLVTFAAGLDTPSGIAFNKDGDLFVADAGSNSIKVIGNYGKVSLFAGAGAGYADGDVSTAQFHAPVGVAVDLTGRVFVADTYNDRIRVIENGKVSTLAGGTRGFADGSGANAKFDTPTGIAVWHDKLLVTDTGNRRIRVVEPDGSVWTLAGNGGEDLKNGLLPDSTFVQPTAVAVGPQGSVFVADGNTIRVIGGLVPYVRTLNRGGAGGADGDLRMAKFNRPSGLAFDTNGDLLVADAENRLVRRISSERTGHEITPDEIAALEPTAEQFRELQPARWPYDPPEAKRDIAGTLGELRGEIKMGDDEVHFHNGLDIAGSYGETARFVRSEKVLRPIATANFGTLRELIRMPTMGYIHIRLGRDKDGNALASDGRFLFERDAGGKLRGVRVPRGSAFKAGDPIGTLNAMNHVHLIAGRSGSEMNALNALILPGVSDTRPPIIEKVTITDESWKPIDPNAVKGKLRVIMRAFDQMDGNSGRRRLGLYRAGYQILKSDGNLLADLQWTINFDRLPLPEAVPFVYAQGSRSGATGETIFDHIVTNTVEGDSYKEGFIDSSQLESGDYIIRVVAADRFGNTSHLDVTIKVIK
jgi:sugar lactone lactonase YvrE